MFFYVPLCINFCCPPLPVALAVVLPDVWKLGYPDGPEMNDYKLQLHQFVSEWEQMQPALTVRHSVLEIGGKSPDDLLQEIVHEMESKCNYCYDRCLKLIIEH